MRKLLLFVFNHRFLAIARWEFYFIRLRVRNVLLRQNQQAHRFLASCKKPIYLNLGSGPRGIDDAHWINVDGFSDKNVQFLIDLNRPLPFPDGCLDGVFSEHVIEHFSLEDGEQIMKGVRTTLREGGVVRIVVPDAELIMRKYFDSPQELVDRRSEGKSTPMEIVNLCFRQRYEHQFLYDWTTMKLMLEHAGFSRVLRSSFRASKLCRALVLDDPKYEWESLYVEAMK
jgi:predicted SAM-dependent methyltransferase